MEESRGSTETVQTPLEVIEDYLSALRGNDISEYERVEGITNDILFDNSGAGSSSECDTYAVITQAKIYELEPTLERRAQLDRSRTFAAVHLVSGMIQGKQIPVEDFPEVIDKVLHTVDMINGHMDSKKARHLLRREIRNVWSSKQRSDPERMRRTAEAYKYVGRPLLLGELFIKLAGIKFTQY